MAHAGEKSGFCAVGLLGGRQGLIALRFEAFALGDVGEGNPYRRPASADFLVRAIQQCMKDRAIAALHGQFDGAASDVVFYAGEMAGPALLIRMHDESAEAFS